MRRFALTLAALLIVPACGMAQTWQPNLEDEMELEVQGAIVAIKEKDPGIEDWFKYAAAYAVYPSVGKAAVGIGGAYGKGLVIAGDKVIGTTSISQVSVGFSLGGQVYSEFIFFRDQTALDDFKRGNYEVGAQASAVAVTKGASADASYNKGVAIFTNTTGGLMGEAAVGGQKFSFEPK